MLRQFLRAAMMMTVWVGCGLPLRPFIIDRAVAQRMEMTPVRRTPAPSLDGGGEWINSSGPITLRQLRGKFVVLDFWTYCCINCLQTLPDLKQLEQAYPRELVVIGVHSPKFFGERDTENIRAAVLRHGVDHAVVNDANLTIAGKYAVQGWPSLRVIDPQGYLIATHGGEATFEMLDRYFRRTVAQYRRSGSLDETPLHIDLERFRAEPTPLRFPGKVLASSSGGRLFIADSGHHRIVITSLDGKLLDIIGTGEIGRADGTYAQATFSHPQGMALDGNSLFVADTENHLIRRIDLSQKEVTTIAGTGEQAERIVVRSTARPAGIDLASPWDLWLDDGNLYIAMAGAHQIWRMTLDPLRLGAFAGTGTEDIVDGDLLPRRAFQQGFAAFAQPSGLTSDGQSLYIADSEGSSIRAIPLRAAGNVTTILGTARLPKARLFTFGDRDGPLAQALLQHPLCVASWQDRLFVADTYNNKLKEIDLEQLKIKTIAGDGQAGSSDQPSRFDEPAGLSVAEGKLYVADTNNHLIRIVDLQRNNAVTTLEIKGLEPPAAAGSDTFPQVPGAVAVKFRTAEVKPAGDQLRLSVQLDLPKGHKIDPDAPMSYVVESIDGSQLLGAEAIGQRVQVEMPANKFEVTLPLAQVAGSAELKFSLVFFYCAEGSGAICKMGGVHWTGRVVLSASASDAAINLRHVVR